MNGFSKTTVLGRVDKVDVREFDGTKVTYANLEIPVNADTSFWITLELRGDYLQGWAQEFLPLGTWIMAEGTSRARAYKDANGEAKCSTSLISYNRPTIIEEAMNFESF